MASTDPMTEALLNRSPLIEPRSMVNRIIPRMVCTDLEPYYKRPRDFWKDCNTESIPNQLPQSTTTSTGMLNAGAGSQHSSKRIKEEPVFGKWKDFPDDIISYMLKFMLVAAEPITNPWTQGMRTIKTQCYEDSDVESFPATAPRILRTASRHVQSTDLLYGQNRFRFTRLIGQLGSEDWSIFVGMNDTGEDGDAFHRFVGYRHKSLNPAQPPMRLHLIRKLSLEDSDCKAKLELYSDFNASNCFAST
ncbi:hypothetical protein EG329_014178 [Mollisiaceae sp. DMI_Dod_QoI]|nr:hypothetical protein EG329_014178 [Helotiales sp. DMI_Dod_QoI]